LERKLYFLIAIALTIVITVGSLTTIEKVVELPSVKFFDKFLHVTAYCLLTFSWLFAFYKSLNFQKKRALIVLVIFIFGIIIEVLQGTLTISRQAETLDLFANLIGIVVAWLFFNLFFKENRMK